MFNRRNGDPRTENRKQATVLADRLKRIAILLLKNIKGLPKRRSSSAVNGIREALDACMMKLQNVKSVEALKDLEIHIKQLISLQRETELLEHAYQYEGMQSLLGDVVISLSQMGEGTGDFADRLNGKFARLLELASVEEQEAIVDDFKREISEIHRIAQEKIQEERESAHRLRQQVRALEEQLVRANEELVIDTLTQLYNRRAFDAKLEEEIKQQVSHGGHFSLLLCDIDHFKEVNDQHGHLVGDRVLRALGETSKRCFRTEDFVARYGGEEFAIILADAGGLHATRSAERFRLTVACKDFQYQRQGKVQMLRITMSIGVASFAPADSPEALIRRADKALYLAKSRGRNRVQIAEDDTEPAE